VNVDEAGRYGESARIDLASGGAGGFAHLDDSIPAHRDVAGERRSAIAVVNACAANDEVVSLFAHRDPPGDIQPGDLLFDTQVENTVLNGGLGPQLCGHPVELAFNGPQIAANHCATPKKTFMPFPFLDLDSASHQQQVVGKRKLESQTEIQRLPTGKVDLKLISPEGAYGVSLLAALVVPALVAFSLTSPKPPVCGNLAANRALI